MFVEENRDQDEITRILNESGVKTESGRWTRKLVRDVLTEQKYIGNNVWYKTSFKLRKTHVRNSANTWIIKRGAFEPIVSPELFYRAQEIRAERARRRGFTNDELLDQLRKLLEREGRLSGPLIDRTQGMLSSASYRKRFDRLVVAFRLAGYNPPKNYGFVDENRELRPLRSKFISELMDRIYQLGGTVTRDPITNVLTVNNEFTALVVIVRCRRLIHVSRCPIWLLPLQHRREADITIAIRMDKENRELMDYYILPRIDTPRLPRVAGKGLMLYERNGASVDIYRFNSLDSFFDMVRHVKAPEAV
jgi:hypothetical protein